jgi:1-acyl-sn-glycerol-3-phosphate acyltransferase
MAAWGFDHYLRRLTSRTFAAVRWGAAEGPMGAEPMLFVANHTNWWDGFVACLLTRRLGLTFQILMDAQHLARYRAFLRVGALPLRRTPPKAAYEDLARARTSLVPGRALWIFPQGERRPAAEPPTDLERGAAHLALGARVPVRVCPVAFRYAFLGEQLPEAFALVGESWLVEGPGDRRAVTARIEDAVGRTLAALDRRLAIEEVGDLEPLVQGRLSINKRLDRFRHAVGLLRGEFEPRNG